ncbi:hypothetical protein BaRGS_00027744 [Batillaria attramentaria]|uniref:Uncharacterized protein n=1 Tax=Batillaria attramentaria TaxID=370345 RepID=A0ABD0K0X4_9CAEN
MCIVHVAIRDVKKRGLAGVAKAQEKKKNMTSRGRRKLMITHCVNTAADEAAPIQCAPECSAILLPCQREN